MEVLFLTCLQAQLIINRVNLYTDLTQKDKIEIIKEIKKFTSEECKIDAKAD